MEVIVSAAATLANSEYTRDSHQDQITSECNAVRVQFNKLLQVRIVICVSVSLMQSHNQLCSQGQGSTPVATEKAQVIQRGLGPLKTEVHH